MFKHNLLIIFRNFARHKMSFFINLIGLSTGMAFSLMIYLWVIDELRMDQFHKNGDRVLQVFENQALVNSIATSDGTTGMLEETLPVEMPEVELAACVAPLYKFKQSTISYNDINVTSRGQYAGKDYFNIFSFPLLQGNPGNALEDKNSIVISEKLSHQLFRTVNNVVGKTIAFQHKKQYRITGIFKDFPKQSSFSVDFMLSYNEFKAENDWLLRWENSGVYTFLLLKKNATIPKLNEKLSGFIKSKNNDIKKSLFAVKYNDTYLHNRYENGSPSGGRIEYVRLFIIIGAIILIIACINFMNLSTVRASQRLKEIGIKKSIGVKKGTLIAQFIGESLIMAVFALVVALILIALLLPQFNMVMKKDLQINFSGAQLIIILIITAITGLLSGSYPAFYLSSYSPIQILKNKFSGSAFELTARRGLVIFQFTLSVVFILCLLVVYKQTLYTIQKNLGYNRDNIISFESEGGLNGVTGKLELFLAEVSKIQGVTAASSSGNHFIGDHSNTTGISWEGKRPGEIISFQTMTFNYGLIEMMGIKMKEGRSYSRLVKSDSAKLILNEAAVKAMALQNPVGRQIDMWGTMTEILGVTENFHFESFHENIKPVIIRLIPRDASFIYLKIQKGKEKEVIPKVQELHAIFNPGFDFNYTFLDEDYQAMYETENKISTLAKYFTAIAILISCLGLFGLSAYTAEKRSKELSIRKVLGASNFNIVMLLSSEFIKIILVAIIIALPLGYLIAENWLQGFVYRLPFQPWYFIVSGLAALLIALFTIIIQALKSAMAKSIKSLKED